MSGRLRGWLAVAVAFVLLVGLLLVNTTDSGSDAVPGGPTRDVAAGRPVPAEPAPGDAAADEQRGSQVRAMLAERAQAVLDGSEAEFMATVAPDADANFVAAQRALFHNLGAVPVEHWSYRISQADQLPVPDELAAAGAEYWAPRTALRYALAGVDVEPTSRPMAYLYVRRGDRWFVASDSALEPQAATWRGLWDFGECVAVPTGSGLVLGHDAADRQLLDAAAGELDEAVRAVSAVWGAAWSQQVAVLVPSTVEQMRALIGPGFNIDGIVAAAIADTVDVGNELALGQRIVLNPELARQLSPAALRIVLRHEITHIAARASTVDGAPMWLLEGMADYIGYRDSTRGPREVAPDLASAVRRGELPTELPAGAEFVGGGPHIDQAYQQAWSVAAYVVDLVGEDGLVRLYQAIAGNRDPGQATVEAAVTDVLGLEFAEFIDGWRQSLLARFG